MILRAQQQKQVDYEDFLRFSYPRSIDACALSQTWRIYWAGNLQRIQIKSLKNIVFMLFLYLLVFMPTAHAQTPAQVAVASAKEAAANAAAALSDANDALKDALATLSSDSNNQASDSQLKDDSNVVSAAQVAVDNCSNAAQSASDAYGNAQTAANNNEATAAQQYSAEAQKSANDAQADSQIAEAADDNYNDGVGDPNSSGATTDTGLDQAIRNLATAQNNLVDAETNATQNPNDPAAQQAVVDAKGALSQAQDGVDLSREIASNTPTPDDDK